MAFQEASSKVREIRDVCQGKPLQVFVCLFVVFFCGCVTDAFIVAFFLFFLSILRNLISGKVSIKTMDISVAHSLHGSERCAMLTHSSILLC